MRDVDEFLDRITDSMSALTVENERLRKGAPPSIVGTPDLADVSRQADEIIERARAEAARIVAEAKATGAQPAGEPGAAASPQEPAAVTAFLTREREFLQSLAGLVQEHAEQVRGMAKTAKRAPAPGHPARGTPSRGIRPEGKRHPPRPRPGHDLTGVGERLRPLRPPPRSRSRPRTGRPRRSPRSGSKIPSPHRWAVRSPKATRPRNPTVPCATCSGARTDRADPAGEANAAFCTLTVTGSPSISAARVGPSSSPGRHVHASVSRDERDRAPRRRRHRRPGPDAELDPIADLESRLLAARPGSSRTIRARGLPTQVLVEASSSATVGRPRWPRPSPRHVLGELDVLAPDVDVAPRRPRHALARASARPAFRRRRPARCHLLDPRPASARGPCSWAWRATRPNSSVDYATPPA